jgi:hypothetical protein
VPPCSAELCFGGSYPGLHLAVSSPGYSRCLCMFVYSCACVCMCPTYVLVYCVRVYMYLYVCICFPTPSVCVYYMCVCVCVCFLRLLECDSEARHDRVTSRVTVLVECDPRRDTKSHGPRTVTPNAMPRITLQHCLLYSCPLPSHSLPMSLPVTYTSLPRCICPVSSPSATCSFCLPHFAA